MGDAIREWFPVGVWVLGITFAALRWLFGIHLKRKAVAARMAAIEAEAVHQKEMARMHSDNCQRYRNDLWTAIDGIRESVKEIGEGVARIEGRLEK